MSSGAYNPADTSVNLTTGAQIGAYTVIAPLGAGGMGEVYRARDSRLGRDVAIKVLLAGLEADRDQIQRFTIEARAIAALNHPNIITVFEVADAGGIPFIATELVEGETLRERISRGPAPLNEAIDIAIQIAEGLAHAHDARIVHRDLKPQNVMIKPDGLVKILDFGLGKMLPAPAERGTETATTRSGTPTTAGTILGTAGYMSPEQVTGRLVDGRSDQFAFGAVLYELLTGHRAFGRETTIETISSVLSDEPTPLATLAPATPAAVVQVVERCLSKQPSDRYASTHDLAYDLQQIKRERTGTRSRSKVHALPIQRRTVAAVGAVLATIILAALATLLLMRSRPAPAMQIAVLPFTNIQRDPANDAFADGIVELLTTNLTRLERANEAWRVVPATDVRRNDVASAKEAHETFGATLVVSGSIQRAGGAIRLTLNLIDGVTQQQLKARVIDARADNPLALQDEAFAALAGMLGAEVQPNTRASLAAGSTLVPGAYDYYVQGRGYLQRYERSESVDNAIGLFRRAVQVDDRFGLAHAALGEALWRKYELTKDASLIADGRAACARSVAIDDQAAPVHVTLALIANGTGEYESAVTEAQRAITLDPVAADGRRELAHAYESLGRYDLAEATYKQAVGARPGDWSTYSALGAFFSGRKRYGEALEQFHRVVELTPDNARGLSNLGGIQFFMKHYEEARVSFEKSSALKPTAAALSNLGVLYFRLHKDDQAARAFQRAVAMDGSDYRVWANLASAYRSLPDAEQRGTEAYRKAIQLAERERATNPRQPRLIGNLAVYYSALGEKDRALSYVREAAALAPGDSTVMVQIGTSYEQLGERASALDWIEKALRAGYAKEDLQEARGLSSLKDDQRFRKLFGDSTKNGD